MRPVEAEGPNRRGVLIGGVLAVAAAGAGAAYWYNRDRPQVYATARGEQRRLLLGDGSRLVLDTDTQITVRLTRERRQIVLDRGRAYFDVAPNPHRPFAVVAGTHEVVALGTAFDVTSESGAVSATLEHGQIAVSGDATELNDYVLSPGDRIIFAADGATTRDRPDIALTMAWRTGRLGFDRETLATAIAEMNQYSSEPLVIGDPAIAHLVISGLYTAGDNEAFAKSVSALLPVTAEIGPKEIILVGAKKMRDPS
jgi:transmembrane sensor